MRINKHYTVYTLRKTALKVNTMKKFALSSAVAVLALTTSLANAAVGVVTGGIVVVAVTLFQKLRGKKPVAAH